MTNAQPPAESSEIAYKNEQNSANTQAGILLADILKTLECTLSARGLLVRKESDLFHPLWYLAETERNIFLWKQGRSIIEHDEFEFWVDLPALIEKRVAQLNSHNESNPFLNPLWSINQESPQGRQRELDYLQAFAELFANIDKHLSALCEAGSRALLEVSGRQRPKIILPQKRPITK